MIKNLLLLMIAIVILSIGYIAGTQKNITENDKSNFQAESQVNTTQLEVLGQQRMLIYRQECQAEWGEKVNVVDNLVQSNSNITKEQAQNIARNAGIADVNGYIIDDDIWIKDCINQKINIFEKAK